jgi:hypothetical protein
MSQGWLGKHGPGAVELLARGARVLPSLSPHRAGQSGQLASRLQTLRQQLRELQQQIDACDEAVEESRHRKRQAPGQQQQQRAQARDKRQRQHGGGGSREGSRGLDSADGSSMDTLSSDSDSESGSEDEDTSEAAVAAPADAVPSSQEVRQQLGPLLQRKQQLKKEAAAAAGALRASSAAVAARRKELRAAVVAQVGWLPACLCLPACCNVHHAYALLFRPHFRPLPHHAYALLCPLLTSLYLPVTRRPQSEVVATTLSSAGGELLQLMPRAASAGSGGIGSGAGASGAPLLGFDAIICDEAAQVRRHPSVLRK